MSAEMNHWTEQDVPQEFAELSELEQGIALDAANSAFRGGESEADAIAFGLAEVKATKTAVSPVTDAPVTADDVPVVLIPDTPLITDDDTPVVPLPTEYAPDQNSPEIEAATATPETTPVDASDIKTALDNLPVEQRVKHNDLSRSLALRVANEALQAGHARLAAIGHGIAAAEEWLHRGGQPSDFNAPPPPARG